MQDTTYTFSVKELAEILKEHEYIKILFYKDGDSVIMEQTYGDPPNKESVYTISVNDLIKAVKKYNGAKIEFYKNGEFAIMGILDDIRPLESIYNEYFYAHDFYEDCDGDTEKFANWLRYMWRNGFDTLKDGTCGHIIHINWVNSEVL